MLTERQGERLPRWLDAVRQDDLPSLRTLAAGIDRDRDAVTAGPGGCTPTEATTSTSTAVCPGSVVSSP